MEMENASGEILGMDAGEEFSLVPKIKIVGVGGAGCNMVDWLYSMNIQGAELIAMNTDYMHLSKLVKAHKKVLLGKEVTRGLGAGGRPELGLEAARASQSLIKNLIEGADMLWILLGLGGGTGTGAAPLIAKIAKDLGIPLVVAVATLPFTSEGVVRRDKAEHGILELRRYADNIILIDNNKILQYAGNLPMQQAFGYANTIIGQMIKGIVETISTPSYINLDFADVRSVLAVGGGASIVGIGMSDSENRAKEAAKRALELPLLEVEYENASGAIIHVEGGENMTLSEINEISSYIQQYLGRDALTILGARINNEMKDKIKVTVIISGVKSPYLLTKWKEATYDPAVTTYQELGIDLLSI